MSTMLWVLIAAVLAAAVHAGSTPQEYDELWTRTGAANSAGGAVAVDGATGDVYTVSTSWVSAATGSNKSVAVERRDASGTSLWSKAKTYGDVTLAETVVVMDGRVFVSGWLALAKFQTFVLCLNATDGSTLWEIKSLSSFSTIVLSLTPSRDRQQIYVLGTRHLLGRHESYIRTVNVTDGSDFTTSYATSYFLYSSIAVDSQGRILLGGDNENKTTRNFRGFARAVTPSGHHFTTLWSSPMLPPKYGMTGLNKASVLQGDRVVYSGSVTVSSSQVAFYSVLSTVDGKLLYSTVGQYGTVKGMAVLGDAQGEDGPYLVGEEQPGRFFIYKYSRQLGLIDRFVYPPPGMALTSTLKPTATAISTTTSSLGRQEPKAIYITGTEETSGVQKVFLKKLRLMDNCYAGRCDTQHGVCIDFVNSSVCQCQLGYGGSDCSQDVDECASSPCLNKGTCQDMVNSFQCICPSGFKGDRCETNINACVSSPCVHGNCRDTVAGYLCVCQTGWTDKTCNASVDDCKNVDCGPGVCLDAHLTYSCKCPAGYRGTHCEVNIDECAPNPCLNNGVCKDGVNSFTCHCPVGTHQPVCQDLDDACKTYPCSNGGQCTDLVNGFSCACAPGFTGTLCEAYIDVCKANKCSAGSTCMNRHGKFYECACPPGKTGKFCDADIDECQSSPCQNGATCLNQDAKFTCRCLPTHTGNLCQTQVTTEPPTTTERAPATLPDTVDVNNADEAAELVQEILAGGEIDANTIDKVVGQISGILLLHGASLASQEKALGAVNTILDASAATLSGSKAADGGLSTALEGFGGAALHGKPEGQSIDVPMMNLAVGAKKVSPDTFSGYRAAVRRPKPNGGRKPLSLSSSAHPDHPPSSSVTDEGGDQLVDFTVPRNVITKGDSSVVNMVVYDDDKLFVPRNKLASTDSIASPVVSMNISGIDQSNLVENVHFTLMHSPCGTDVACKYECVYWSYQSESWATEGCTRTSSAGETQTTCSCSHLTNFAILASASPLENEHTETLSILSLACGITSMVGLGLTCIIIGLFRKLRGMTAMKITFCFSMSMFLALIFLLVGAERTANKSACYATAILIHFFVLATMSWSLVMAINLYRNLVTVFARKSKNVINYYHLIGWGIPTLLVLIAVLGEFAGKQQVYVTTHYCWFNSMGWYGATFLSEMGAIWLINIIVFILVLRTLNRKSMGKYDMKKNRAQTKINLTIFNQLSLVWVFAFVALATTGIASRIFEYLFAISTTLQGLGVFFLCVLMNREIRNTVRETAISSGMLSSSAGSSTSGNTKSTSGGGASRVSRMSRFSSRLSLGSFSGGGGGRGGMFSSLSRKDSLKSNGSGRSGENSSVVIGNEGVQRSSSLNRKDSFGLSTLGRHNEQPEETHMMEGKTNPYYKPATDSSSDTSSVVST